MTTYEATVCARRLLTLPYEQRKVELNKLLNRDDRKEVSEALLYVRSGVTVQEAQDQDGNTVSVGDLVFKSPNTDREYRVNELWWSPVFAANKHEPIPVHAKLSDGSAVDVKLLIRADAWQKK